jgi:hypothetical protein
MTLVGAGALDGPLNIASSPVILSERSESKDLQPIVTPEILRLRSE